MSNISYQIIPFAFLFILLLLYTGMKNKKTKISKVSKTAEKPNLKEYEIFLLNSEKKLIALRELYRQDLIDLNVYVSKTKTVANSIAKTIGKDITALSGNLNIEIHKQLRNNIRVKAKSISTKDSEKNIDNLINAVDKRIESGLKYD
tara:strand:+ start:24 stop:464 length:441 start_codon:yes stop_codon:yes gene_type:complete